MGIVARKRMSILRPLVVAGIGGGLSGVAWTGLGLYIYWNDPKLVNFLAAWIPFVLSILIAFVPEREMTPSKKWLWRSSVIVAGFIWSVVLWHQQVVTEVSAKNDQESIVRQAVTKSNQHSDQQIASVRSDVGDARKDVGKLQKETENLAGLVSKSETNITAGLSKVGKPDPPEPVRLLASFFPTEHDISWPIAKRTIHPSDDGTFTVDLTFRNIAQTSAASNFDIWIEISPGCHFAIEPAGFDQPKGGSALVRHRTLPLLNPGVTEEKQSFMIKVDPPFKSFEIGFRYSCQNCDAKGLEAQRLKVTAGYLTSPFG
jgi:hypothetical protein